MGKVGIVQNGKLEGIRHMHTRYTYRQGNVKRESIRTIVCAVHACKGWHKPVRGKGSPAGNGMAGGRE